MCVYVWGAWILLSLSMIVNTVLLGYSGNTGKVKCTLVSGRQTKILGTFCLSASRRGKTIEMTPDEVRIITQWIMELLSIAF